MMIGSEHPSGWERVVFSVSLRGAGNCVWLSGSKELVEGMGWFGMSPEATGEIIAAERKDMARLFEYMVRMNGPGEMTECHYDFTGQMNALLKAVTEAPGDTKARLERIMPVPMLVPPVYPYSVPLDVTGGCARKARCAMCKFPRLEGMPSMETLKVRIKEWAATLGHLVGSTQSVFLGRDSLPPVGMDLEILNHLKSDEIYYTMMPNLPPQVEEHVDFRIHAWGNIARFSAFARVCEINGMPPGHLEELRANGLTSLVISAETGSDRVRQEILGKDYTNAEIESAVERALKAGMSVKIVFMLGISGRELRDEHMSMSARLISRLEKAAEPHGWRVMFLISPLDYDSTTEHVRRLVPRPTRQDLMDELRGIGIPAPHSYGMNPYLSCGAQLSVPDCSETSFQVYAFSSLFV